MTFRPKWQMWPKTDYLSSKNMWSSQTNVDISEKKARQDPPAHIKLSLFFSDMISTQWIDVGTNLGNFPGNTWILALWDSKVISEQQFIEHWLCDSFSDRSRKVIINIHSEKCSCTLFLQPKRHIWVPLQMVTMGPVSLVIIVGQRKCWDRAWFKFDK